MLLIYRLDTGEIFENTGTNTGWPDGPPDDFVWRNIDAQGLSRSDFDFVRLNDIDDHEMVDLIFNNSTHVDPSTKEIVIDGPRPAPEPDPDPEPDPVMARLIELENEVRGMRDRTAAAAVTNADAAKIRDAITGPPQE